MNTTVEASRTASSFTTSRSRLPLTDKTPTLEGGYSVNLTSSYTASTPSEAPAYGPSAGDGLVHYRDLSPQDRSNARDTLKELSGQGRLWVTEGDHLRRAEPAEVKERLDHGQGVELVSRMGGEREDSGSSYLSSYTHSRGFFAAGVNNYTQADTNSHAERVSYSRSPLTSWDSLDFVETDRAGVQGTGQLPASGGMVTLSSDYESNWHRHTDEQWGIFTQKENLYDNTSSLRRHSEA